MTEKLFTGTLNHNQNKTKQILLNLHVLIFDPPILDFRENPRRIHRTPFKNGYWSHFNIYQQDKIKCSAELSMKNVLKSYDQVFRVSGKLS